MQKRIWKKEEKIAIIEEAEKAPTVAEVLRKYNVAQSIYYKWKRQFEAYGESAFDNKYYEVSHKSMEIFVGKENVIFCNPHSFSADLYKEVRIIH